MRETKNIKASNQYVGRGIEQMFLEIRKTTDKLIRREVQHLI